MCSYYGKIKVKKKEWDYKINLSWLFAAWRHSEHKDLKGHPNEYSEKKILLINSTVIPDNSNVGMQRLLLLGMLKAWSGIKIVQDRNNRDEVKGWSR